jgi:hypothetical protein
MPLTQPEIDFLTAFVYEATIDPFKGPATEALHRCGIYYTDIPSLLAAYYREHPPNQQGFGGQHNPKPPSCPWQSREEALHRERELREENHEK